MRQDGVRGQLITWSVAATVAVVILGFVFGGYLVENARATQSQTKQLVQCLAALGEADEKPSRLCRQLIGPASDALSRQNHALEQRSEALLAALNSAVQTSAQTLSELTQAQVRSSAASAQGAVLLAEFEQELTTLCTALASLTAVTSGTISPDCVHFTPFPAVGTPTHATTTTTTTTVPATTTTAPGRGKK